MGVAPRRRGRPGPVGAGPLAGALRDPPQRLPGLPSPAEACLVPRPHRHPHVADAGIWEEEGPTKAVHLSSVGAVAAGLTQAARIGVKDLPERLQLDTTAALLAMGGRESQHHDTDLALPTLVSPLGDDLPLPRAKHRAIVG